MSAAEPTIICPKCKAEIKPTAPLAESIRPENENRFNPDYAVHPGAILEETLEARGLTKRDTASRCGISAKHLNWILHGKAQVVPDLAISLERVVGVPADLWTNLQSQYELHQARDLSGCRSQ